MRAKARALFFPWLIGAVGAGIVGAAAWNLSQEAKTAAGGETATETDGVPELAIIPELHVVEAYDPDNVNAPS